MGYHFLLQEIFLTQGLNQHLLHWQVFFVCLFVCLFFTTEPLGKPTWEAVMYGCESGTIKIAEHQRIDDFELWCWRRLFESPLDCKEIQPVHPKGNQFWIFIGRTDAEAEAPTLWPPVAKNWLTGKDPDAGKDWRQEEKGTKEDEMVGWHHRLDGHEFEQAPGVVNGQGRLACCKESDTTEQLNWTV